MSKKYVVRLAVKERRILREVITTLNGSSQKVQRAQMLLKADASGPACMDEQPVQPIKETREPIPATLMEGRYRMCQMVTALARKTVGMKGHLRVLECVWERSHCVSR